MSTEDFKTAQTVTDEPEKLDLHSFDISGEKRAALLALFPEARTEGGKIDLDRLKLALGETVDVGKERYQMNWPGKADCFRAIQTPSVGTLRPVREESVNFDMTKNLIIEGDNLEVLKLLQKSYLGKIKMIYIDPPYNTGNDFIYPDNYGESLETYLEYTGQIDAEGKKFGTNTESDGRFHSKWLNMMYPRVYLARNLLKEEGVIFVSCDDNEVHNLRILMNELFGESNFLGCAARVSKKANNQGDYWSPNFDYVLTYARNRDSCPPFTGGANEEAYNQVESSGPRKGDRYQELRLYMTSLDPMRGCTNQRYWIKCPDGSFVIPPGDSFPADVLDAASIVPQSGNDKVWRWTKNKYEQEKQSLVIKKVRSSNLIDQNGNPAKWNVYTKAYLKDVLERATAKPNSLIEDHINQVSSHELRKLGIPFPFAKPSSLIKYLCEISRVQDGDTILDFFAGSGSTAQGVLEWGAEIEGDVNFILVQLPEPCSTDSDEYKAGFKTIAEITKERVRRVISELESRAAEQLQLLPARTKDRGVRIFKLAESNFEPWNVHAAGDVATLSQQLALHVDHVRQGRTEDDILCELLLKSGFPLTTLVETKAVEGKTMYIVAGGALVICLNRALTLDVIRAIAEMKPERVVCLDEGFAGNDQLKTNAVQTFKTKGITSFKTV